MRVGDEPGCCLPELEAWVAKNLPKSYRWPGNYRELEQCVRNFVIRGSYRPLDRQAGQEAARRMGMDRRTVKAKVESYLKANSADIRN